MALLSKRVNKINESQTIAMAQRSRDMKAKGIDVINLSLGEPDFATPQHIKDAAKKAIDDNFSYYPPIAGYLDLRQAICHKLLRDNGLQYTPDQIVVSTGAKQSIINVLLCLIDEGDEVIVPAPFWVSYLEMIKLCDGKAVMLPTNVSSNFKITPQQLEQAITPQTKAFLFSSPSNPTGSAYTEEELGEFAKIFEKNPHITIISDEIYEFINFLGKHYSLAQFPAIKNQCVVVNGVSKGFAMTGWRLGYIAAPLPIAQACTKIQGQFTSAASSITQKATIAALNGSLKPTLAMCEAFKKRRDLIYNGLMQIEGLKCNYPDGAFYVFPDVSAFFSKSFEGKIIHNADDLALYLLEQAHVATVTGEAFGNAECLRISFAASNQDLIEAVKRITKALEQLV